MTKLKTLKDFRREVPDGDKGLFIELMSQNQTLDMLRIEAIKHIKKLTIPEKDSPDWALYEQVEAEYPITDYDIEWGVSAEDWIKHFFNITEEDLK